MATAAPVADIPDVLLKTLECSICLVYYNTSDRQAQVLRCGHCFCKVCVESMLDYEEIICPKCRDSGTTRDMKKNFAINEMLETLCDDCTKRLKIHPCVHCIKQYCEPCYTQHTDVVQKAAERDMDMLSKNISDAKSVLEEVHPYGLETSRQRNAMESLHSDVRRLRDALDSFETDMEEQLRRLNESNTKMCDKWKDDIEKCLSAGQAILHKYGNIRDPNCDRCDMKVIQTIKEECLAAVGKIQNVLKKDPDMKMYTYKSKNIQGDLDCGSIQLANAIGEKPSTCESSTVKSTSHDDAAAGASQASVPFYNIRLNRIIGRYGCGRDQFNRPRDVAIAPNGNIYITDSKNHRVKIFNSRFELISLFGRKGTNYDQFMTPSGICCNLDNKLFIGDGDRIQVYSADGKYERSIGAFGPDYAKVNNPEGVLTVGDTLLYVCESDDMNIKVFNQNGNFIRTIGDRVFGDGPYFLALTDTNKIISNDVKKSSLIIFDSKDNASILKPKQMPDDAKPFVPSGITVDNLDNIFVADENELIILDKDGMFLQSFGSDQDPWNFDGLRGLALDHNGHLIVCDSFNNRVLVFDIIVQ